MTRRHRAAVAMDIRTSPEIRLDESMSILMDVSLPHSPPKAHTSAFSLASDVNIDELDDAQLEELAWRAMKPNKAMNRQGNPSSPNAGATFALQLIPSPNVEVRKRLKQRTPHNTGRSFDDTSNHDKLSPSAVTSMSPPTPSASSSSQPLKESRQERRQRLGLAGRSDKRQQRIQPEEQHEQHGAESSVAATSSPLTTSPNKRTLPSMLPFSPYHKKPRPARNLDPISSSSPFRPGGQSELLKLMGRAHHPSDAAQILPSSSQLKISWLKKDETLLSPITKPTDDSGPSYSQRDEACAIEGPKSAGKDFQSVTQPTRESSLDEQPNSPTPSQEGIASQSEPVSTTARRSGRNSRQHGYRQTDCVEIAEAAHHSQEVKAPPEPVQTLPRTERAGKEVSNPKRKSMSVSTRASSRNSVKRQVAEALFAPLMVESGSAPPSDRLPSAHYQLSDETQDQVVASITRAPSTNHKHDFTASLHLPGPSLTLGAGGTRQPRKPQQFKQLGSVDVPLGFRKTSTGSLVPVPPSAEPSTYVSASEHFGKLLAKAQEHDKRLRERSEVKTRKVPDYLIKRKEEIDLESAEMFQREIEMIRGKELRGVSSASAHSSASTHGQMIPAKKTLPAGLMRLPATGHHPNSKPMRPTKSQPFVSSLEKRKAERQVYQSRRAARDALLEKEREKVREEKRRLEEEETKRERERRIPRAHPVPDFIYGPPVQVEARGGDIGTRRRRK